MRKIESLFILFIWVHTQSIFGKTTITYPSYFIAGYDTTGYIVQAKKNTPGSKTQSVESANGISINKGQVLKVISRSSGYYWISIVPTKNEPHQYILVPEALNSTESQSSPAAPSPLKIIGSRLDPSKPYSVKHWQDGEYETLSSEHYYTPGLTGDQRLDLKKSTANLDLDTSTNYDCQSNRGSLTKCEGPGPNDKIIPFNSFFKNVPNPFTGSMEPKLFYQVQTRYCPPPKSQCSESEKTIETGIVADTDLTSTPDLPHDFNSLGKCLSESIQSARATLIRAYNSVISPEFGKCIKNETPVAYKDYMKQFLPIKANAQAQFEKELEIFNQVLENLNKKKQELLKPIPKPKSNPIRGSTTKVSVTTKVNGPGQVAHLNTPNASASRAQLLADIDEQTSSHKKTRPSFTNILIRLMKENHVDTPFHKIYSPYISKIGFPVDSEKRAIDSMARMIYAEMRGEMRSRQPDQDLDDGYGMAVAKVTLNRALVIKKKGLPNGEAWISQEEAKDLKLKERSLNDLLISVIGHDRQYSSLNPEDVNLDYFLCPKTLTDRAQWNAALQIAHNVVLPDRQRQFIADTKDIVETRYRSRMGSSWTDGIHRETFIIANKSSTGRPQSSPKTYGIVQDKVTNTARKMTPAEAPVSLFGVPAVSKTVAETQQSYIAGL